jgi:ribosomal protein S18 acetylase RimI-like enzyme
MIDERFPDLWDANNATVLEPSPSITVSEIRDALLEPVRQVGAPTEHIEFWETSAASPALRELRVAGQQRTPDVVMTFGGGNRPELGELTAVHVEEVTSPGVDFLSWYRSTLNEFGTQLSEAVLDQLVRRAVDVFLPAGMRWFVATLGDRRAGYTSLVSLDGVGYLDNVVTMPAFRKRGVATATVSRAVDAGRDSGDRAIFLLAEEGGGPQRLYERLGFRTTSRVESFTRPIPAI